MTKKSSPMLFRFHFTLLLLLAVTVSVGCSHKKTNRGHLFRCEWAFEHNRTPWIGCPPDSGCDDERGCSVGDNCECGAGQSSGLLGLLKKDGGKCCCNQEKKNKGFRRHCGMNPECTAKKPCCRTLGCGMWVDPSDPNTFATLGSGVKACGLTAFCSPMKPCCLTPHCGRVTNQPLMLGNGGIYPAVQPVVTPTPVMPKPEGGNEQKQKKPPTVAGPNGLLISRGIVPGVSTMTNGGVVAAVGVATPVGVMTPAGVQLPNGMVNGNAVIRACAAHGCSAARPCCMTPGCGMWVPVSTVSNNATMLASALRTPGMANNVMQAGAVPGYADGGVMTAHGIAVNRTGNGMLVNPVTGQPVAGLSMNGYPQNGYPPIGYAPTGYSPGYPRYAPQVQAEEGEEEEEEETVVEAETKSQMPVPRFHPIPTKPAFQRSEGMTIPNRTGAANSRRIFSDDALDAAVEQAYLEGMSDAMNEVEAELEAQTQELARAQLQEKVLNQAKKLQTQLDSQKELELQVLEMQKQQELAEKKARAQARQLAEQVAAERTAQKQAAREAEMFKARWQQAEIEQTALRQPQQMQPMQMPIPTGFNQSSISPAHYYADAPPNGSGKNVFTSAMETLKGSGERQPRGVPMQAPTQRMPVQQQAMMPAQPGYSTGSPAGNGGNGWMHSARSFGSNMVSAVSEAVSPISGLLGSDRPLPPPGSTPYPSVPQNSMRTVSRQPAPVPTQMPYFTGSAPVRTRATTNPCPPCPPFYPVPVVQPKAAKRFAENGVAPEIEDGFDLSESVSPKKPPVRKKAPKKVIDVDDEDDGPMIRQAHFEDRE